MYRVLINANWLKSWFYSVLSECSDPTWGKVCSEAFPKSNFKGVPVKLCPRNAQTHCRELLYNFNSHPLYPPHTHHLGDSDILLISQKTVRPISRQDTSTCIYTQYTHLTHSQLLSPNVFSVLSASFQLPDNLVTVSGPSLRAATDANIWFPK